MAFRYFQGRGEPENDSKSQRGTNFEQRTLVDSGVSLVQGCADGEE